MASAGGRLVEVAAPAELGASLRREATVRWRGEDGWRAVRTEAPGAVLRDLLGTTAHEVHGLSVTRPGLEDVYLALIGATPGGEPR